MIRDQEAFERLVFEELNTGVQNAPELHYFNPRELALDLVAYSSAFDVSNSIGFDGSNEEDLAALYRVCTTWKLNRGQRK